MDIKELKELILDKELIPEILNSIGCHHIKHHGDYYTCGNKDGDNPNSIVVYLNEYITCINYTRQITKHNQNADIFDLISFAQDVTFSESMKFVCNIAGVGFYDSIVSDIPESLQILKLLNEMTENIDEDTSPLKPIPEEILSYYLPYGNKMFTDDNISLEIQLEFEIKYDPSTNYIIIPIRDDIGTLCGCKGRYLGVPDSIHSKYTYIEKCNKGKILYGYWQNKQFIKKSKFLYIVESEKAVQQLATVGIRNVVATGGKTISKYQVELISRTGCLPIFALDEDVKEEEIEAIASMFVDGIDVFAIIDRNNILLEKQSPSDDIEKWNILTKNNIYKILKK